MSQLAKQITEIRSLLGQGSQGGSGKQNSRGEAPQQQFTPREASVLQLVAEGLMNADE